MELRSIVWTLITVAMLLLTAAFLMPTIPSTKPATATGSRTANKVPICHRTSLAKSSWQSISLTESEVPWSLDHGDFIIDDMHPCPPVTTSTTTETFITTIETATTRTTTVIETQTRITTTIITLTEEIGAPATETLR